MITSRNYGSLGYQQQTFIPQLPGQLPTLNTSAVILPPKIMSTTIPGSGLLQGSVIAAPAPFVGDIDPITPGIQVAPGTLIPTGPSSIVSGGFGNQGFGTQQIMGRGFFGGVDVDPITPGTQLTPGIVHQTGPSQFAGRVGGNLWDCCPWWIWTIIGLLLLGLFVGGIYGYTNRNIVKQGQGLNQSNENKQKQVKKELSQNQNDDEQNDQKGEKNNEQKKKDEVQTVVNVRQECEKGYKNKNGECVTCPNGSTWDGKKCTLTVKQISKNSKTTIVQSISNNQNQKQQLSTETFAPNKQQSYSKSSNIQKTVPVFVSVEGSKGVDEAIVKSQNTQPKGEEPTTISSKPTLMKPNVRTNARMQRQRDQSTVSNNIVSIPARTQIKSLSRSVSSVQTSVIPERTPYLGYGNSGQYTLDGGFQKSSKSSIIKGVTRTKKEIVEPIVVDPKLRHLMRM